MAQTGYTPILIYSTTTAAGVPSAANLTNSTLGSELAINITDGKLFYKDNGGSVQVIGWKTTPTSAGGTGLTSYTAGDTLYFASGTALSKLAIGASKTIMTSSGTAPQWSASLDTSQGGTGLTSYTAGDLVYYATGTALTKLAIGANTYILTSNGTAPTWAAPSAVSIGTATNIAGGAAGSVPYQTAASTTTMLAIGSAYQALQVNAGGTAPSWQPSASSVLTAQGDLLYASAANTLARLAKNTTATRYLANTGTSNNPSWDQVNLANGVTGTLPVANGGTNLTSYTSGGILYASGTGTLATTSNLTTNGSNVAMIGTSVLLTIQDNSTANNTRMLLSAEGTAAYIGGTYSSSNFPTIFTQAGTSSGVERWRTDTNGYFLIGYNASNGAYKLQVNSQIFATSATIATSDAKYKENVQPLTGCLALVNQLNPVSFTWKKGLEADGVPNPNWKKQFINEQGELAFEEDGTPIIDNRQWLREPHSFNDGVTIGFLAQQVKETLKDTPFVDNLIKENTRPAVIGRDGQEIAPASTFMGIAEGNMIALLTKALQELNDKFDAYVATHP